MCVNSALRPTSRVGKLRAMYLRLALCLLVVTGCFRESPPCDQATRARIKATCTSEADCLRQLEERAAVCEERMRRGD